MKLYICAFIFITLLITSSLSPFVMIDVSTSSELTADAEVDAVSDNEIISEISSAIAQTSSSTLVSIPLDLNITIPRSSSILMLVTIEVSATASGVGTWQMRLNGTDYFTMDRAVSTSYGNLMLTDIALDQTAGFYIFELLHSVTDAVTLNCKLSVTLVALSTNGGIVPHTVAAATPITTMVTGWAGIPDLASSLILTEDSEVTILMVLSASMNLNSRDAQFTISVDGTQQEIATRHFSTKDAQGAISIVTMVDLPAGVHDVRGLHNIVKDKLTIYAGKLITLVSEIEGDDGYLSMEKTVVAEASTSSQTPETISGSEVDVFVEESAYVLSIVTTSIVGSTELIGDFDISYEGTLCGCSFNRGISGVNANGSVGLAVRTKLPKQGSVVVSAQWNTSTGILTAHGLTVVSIVLYGRQSEEFSSHFLMNIELPSTPIYAGALNSLLLNYTLRSNTSEYTTWVEMTSTSNNDVLYELYNASVGQNTFQQINFNSTQHTLSVFGNNLMVDSTYILNMSIWSFSNTTFDPNIASLSELQDYTIQKINIHSLVQGYSQKLGVGVSGYYLHSWTGSNTTDIVTLVNETSTTITYIYRYNNTALEYEYYSFRSGRGTIDQITTADAISYYETEFSPSLISLDHLELSATPGVCEILLLDSVTNDPVVGATIGFTHIAELKSTTTDGSGYASVTFDAVEDAASVKISMVKSGYTTKILNATISEGGFYNSYTLVSTTTTTSGSSGSSSGSSPTVIDNVVDTVVSALDSTVAIYITISIVVLIAVIYFVKKEY